jgi:hypothetical protein
MLYSLGLTYLMGHMVHWIQPPSIPFSTKSYEKLQAVAAVAAHDSSELFHDMLLYNPFFTELAEKFMAASQQASLLLDQIQAEQHTT